MFPLESKILITGSKGLVGSALTEELRRQGYTNLKLLTKEECDLRNLGETISYFQAAEPDVVFHNAASVFGLGGNLREPASIFLDNILINTHVIEASHLAKAKKVIAMGSIAAYPVPKAPLLQEEHVWDGPPHASESSYSHAKRAMLAQLLAYHDNYNLDYAYVLSTNLYGPHDKFNPECGHVIPSLIRKFYEAKQENRDVVIWGDGSAKRDFLYSKDMAKALVLIMNRYSGAINVASGIGTSIREVVYILSDLFEMHLKVQWDPKMPNGRHYSPVDLTRAQSIGCKPEYSIEKGLLETVSWFCKEVEKEAVRK